MSCLRHLARFHPLALDSRSGSRSIVTTLPLWNAHGDGSTCMHGHIQARLDYKHLAANLDAAIANVEKRMCIADPALVVQLYEQQVKRKQTIDRLRAERNTIAKRLGQAKAQGTTVDGSLRSRGQELKTQIQTEELVLEQLVSRLEEEALRIPNETHPKVPIDDEVLSTHGIKPVFDRFVPKDHYDLAMELNLIDTQSASKVSGSKFVFLCNEAAMLELALVHWTLAKLRQRGFIITLPPDIAHSKIVEGCGFQPRGEATQIYSIANTDLCLAATSEITLAGMKTNEILETASLPLRYAGFSHCFRTEIGHGGRATRGLYRIHQFSKVEMFGFCANMEQSMAFYDEMIAFQIEMLTELGLHFQLMEMASSELGAPAYRKIDVEAWMPGRNEYGEVASLSMCTDYQSRRLNIRHQEPCKKESPQFVHTLNGTACAVPRLLISILETYQNKDGSIRIPDVLQPYMGMQRVINKASMLRHEHV